MSNQPPLFYVGERDPSITDTITADGAAVDLTGCTVRFRMRALGSSTLKVDAPASVVSAAAGTVRYDWAAADVDTEGFYACWWLITYSDAKTQAKPEFTVEFRAHGPRAGDLVELAEVRLALELEEVDDQADARLRQLITHATTKIEDFLQRQIHQTTAVTHRFTLGGRSRLVDFAPWDLRSGPNAAPNPVVTLDPLGAAQVLTAETDYTLEPIGADEWGVYLGLLLSNYLVTVPERLFRFGVVEVDVEADWGFAAVPEQAKEACFIALKSWLRAPYSGGYRAEDPRDYLPDTPVTYELPLAAKRAVNELRRAPGVV